MNLYYWENWSSRILPYIRIFGSDFIGTEKREAILV